MTRISLPEMMQVFALSPAAKTVRVSDQDGRQGWMRLGAGKVVHASTDGALQGFEALVEMLTWPRARSFIASSTTELDSNIDEPISVVLMDAFEASEGKEPTEEPTGVPELDDPSDGSLEEQTSRQPTDNVSFVLSVTASLSNLQGFVVAFVLDPKTDEVVDTFGDAVVDVPDWTHETLQTLAKPGDVRFSLVSSGPYLDLMIPKTRYGRPGVLCRMVRSNTNLGLALHKINELAREDS